MRTITYTTLESSVIRNLGYDPTSGTESPARLKAEIAEYATQAADIAWHWCVDGWPECRKAASRTAASNVISMTRSTGIDAIGQVLNVSERHPWTSVNPGPLPFLVTGDGIVLNDDVGASATVYVSYLKPAPRYTSTAWVTSTAYVVGDLAQQSGLCYECVTAHTSGTFATDLAAGKWELQEVPAFLATPLKTAITAALRETGGQTQRMRTLDAVLNDQLDAVAARYDFSRGGGQQRITTSTLI